MSDTVFSFEIFPPKKDVDVSTTFGVVDELSSIKPDFISVTYGAGGKENCWNTIQVAKRIKDVCGVQSVAHLPCINMTKGDVQFVLERFQEAGIKSILALRGNKMQGRDSCDDFTHASDLVTFIRDFDSKRTDGGRFRIFGSCYPEMHIESRDIFSDINGLKAKVDAGAERLLSQFFFDNETFYRFVERARLVGIDVPIDAGIMPATDKALIEQMTANSNTVLPKKFVRMMEKYSDSPEAIRDAGIAYAIDQIVDLVSSGVDGIHLYIMNNPYTASRIHDAVRSLFKVSPISKNKVEVK